MSGVTGQSLSRRRCMAADPAPTGDAEISWRTMARGLVLDVGLPLVTYYGLHAAGVSDWFALLGATLVAGARIVLVAVGQRVLNALGLIMLVMFGLGLALTFATGGVRFLVLKTPSAPGCSACSSCASRWPGTR